MAHRLASHLLNYNDFEAFAKTEQTQPAAWVKSEFASVNIGDKRLDARLIKTCELLSMKPSMPIPQACGDWASSKGAYRLFDNKAVDPGKIVAPHIEKTTERMRDHNLVLAIQDTVFFSYAHPSATGLGPVGKGGENDGQGLVMHHTLAITPEGLPLGILHQSIWARDEVREETKAEKMRRLKEALPEEKESWKWLKALGATQKNAPSGVKVVTVADRECDFFEFIAAANSQASSFVIRAKHDRKLDADDDSAFDKISNAVQGSEVRGRYTIEILGNSKRSSREAEVEVRFCEVTIPPPASSVRTNADPEPLVVNVIAVREVSSPHDAEPISWVLLTNERVQSFASACEKIGWYCKRWMIEIYHKIMKSGCKVEERYLEKGERLARCLALFSVIAFRLLFMTYVARVSPDAPCTEILSESEWHALYCLKHKTAEVPKVPPTVKEAIRWIGGRGGHLGRKSDGEPGPIVLWRGFQELMVGAEIWRTLRPQGPVR